MRVRLRATHRDKKVFLDTNISEEAKVCDSQDLN
jgi:hypothetical protein